MNFSKAVVSVLLLTLMPLCILFVSGCEDDSDDSADKIIPTDFADVWFLWGRSYPDNDSLLFNGGLWLLDLNEFGLWSWGESNRVYMVGSAQWEQVTTNTANMDMLVEDAIDTSIIDEHYLMTINYNEYRANFSYYEDGKNTHDIYIRPEDDSFSLAGFVTTIQRNPVSNIQVEMDILDSDENLTTYTDDYGFYIFRNLEADDYRLTFSGSGYITKTIPSDDTYKEFGDKIIEPVPVVIDQVTN